MCGGLQDQFPAPGWQPEGALAPAQGEQPAPAGQTRGPAVDQRDGRPALDMRQNRLKRDGAEAVVDDFDGLAERLCERLTQHGRIGQDVEPLVLGIGAGSSTAVAEPEREARRDRPEALAAAVDLDGPREESGSDRCHGGMHETDPSGSNEIQSVRQHLSLIHI